MKGRAGRSPGSRARAGLAAAVACALALAGSAACASKPAGPEAEVNRDLAEDARLVPEHVRDPERAAEVKSMILELKQEFDAAAAAIEKKQQELEKAMRRYETTDEELRKLVADLRSDEIALEKTLQDGHFALREKVTEAEWKAIVDHRRRSSESPVGGAKR